jgi:protoporphyrinogen oxidase
LVWFWARIFVRTPSLAYPKGGFLFFAKHLAEVVEKKEGKIFYNTASVSIKEKNNQVSIQLNNLREQVFDKVIFTLPSFILLQQEKQLPESYIKDLSPLKGLAATNLVLRLKKKFFKDNTYWLSICDTTSPLMVAVEHTNFMDAKHYNNEHIVYLGKYMRADSDRFAMDKEKTLASYDDFLRKINPDYKKDIIGYELFRAPFAQPIVPVNYSKMMPVFDTPIPNLFLANMQQVYPWDRGTNYAVELGQKIAQHILHE